MLRFDALGDTLLSTPAIRRLAESCSEVKPSATSAEIADLLRQRKPDAVFCFSEKRRSLQAAWRSRCERRVGFFPGLSQPLKALYARTTLTHRWTFPNDPSVDPGVHEVDRYGHLLEQVGVDASNLGPLFFPSVDTEPARSWLSQHGIERPLGLQLSPKWLQDGWPCQWLRELSKRLPGPVIGLFGPAEADWALASFQDLPMKLAPVGSLNDYAGLLSQCRQLVTIDTGAAHLAAALSIPVVDVFPERNHPHCVRRWRPWQVAHEVVLKPLHQSSLESRLLAEVLAASSKLDSRGGEPGPA